MKRKILIGSAVIAIAGVTTVNFGLNSKTSGISDLSLANIEALADDESYTQIRICYYGIEGMQGAPMEDRTYCPECSFRPCYKYWNESNYKGIN